MIAHSEIGPALLKISDDGYNVIVGSSLANPNLFKSYADHPRQLIHLSPTLSSTAAGRYQLLARYYDAYKASLHLLNFCPTNQDTIALQQIGECHAREDINAGNFESAVSKCSRIWASLPGATYGQHTNKIEDLKAAYLAAGGALN